MTDLSKRLQTIASLVPDGARVCDIGTDHAYLSIELKKSGKVSSIIAADINPQPLKNAEYNIKKSGVEGIELRLCDGLSGIKKNEVDTIVIAGMGGEVISGIVERGIEIAKGVENIILQPTTSPEFLRKFLYKNGFEIKCEVPVYENDKLYSVMLVSPSYNTTAKDEYFYYIGKVSPHNKSGLLYIQKQYDRCSKCAESLKNVPQKQKEYSYYKSIVEDIEKYLKNFTLENK